MNVELLTVPDCPNADRARHRIAEAARQVGVAVTIDHRVIDSEDEAAARGMRGSPTILVDGVNVVTVPADVGRLACLVDLDRGMPSIEQLAELLTDRAD